MDNSKPGKFILKIDKQHDVFRIMVLAYLEYTDKYKKNFKLISPSKLYNGNEYIDNSFNKIEMIDSNIGMASINTLKTRLENKEKNPRSTPEMAFAEYDDIYAQKTNRTIVNIKMAVEQYIYGEGITGNNPIIRTINSYGISKDDKDKKKIINQIIDLIDKLNLDEKLAAEKAFDDYFSKKKLNITPEVKTTFYEDYKLTQCFYFMYKPDKPITIHIMNIDKKIDPTKLPEDGYIELEHSNNSKGCIIN